MQPPNTRQKSSKSLDGRYKTVHDAPSSAIALPKKEARLNKDIRHAMVENPDTETKKRMKKVAVNIRTDVLEQEYAYHRISDAAYRAGRFYQKKLEYAQSQSSFGSAWSNEPRVDRSRNPDGAMIYRLENARKVTQMIEETRPIIGLLGERLLRLILGEGLTLSQAASQFGDKGDLTSEKKGKHIISLYAWQFRQALEALAEHWKDSH